MHDGLLLIDKPTGMTSHDVVQKVRRALGQKKVGHCGTLDPNATGLLLMTLGRATRLTRFLIRAPKVYEGSIQLGAATDTYDAMGEVASEAPFGDLALADVDGAMARFVGSLEHAAPPYSAKKVQGKKLYELARQGAEVPVKTKQVEVYEFTRRGTETVGEGWAEGLVPFRLACASGTYARTLAHDLGAALGCGAHLATLRRVQIGPFDLADALTLEELEERLAAASEAAAAAGDANGAPKSDPASALGAAWVPFHKIPLPFGEVTTDHGQEERVRHGQTVLVRALEGEEGDWIKLVNRREELIAVGTVVERIGEHGVGVVQPRVVFD